MYITRKNLKDKIKNITIKKILFDFDFDLDKKELDRSFLENKIIFSPKCANTWYNNIKCTIDNCFNECKYNIICKNINDNKCIKCDEKLCGDDFKKNSGSTRRNLGIISGIDRENKEISINGMYYNINDDLSKLDNRTLAKINNFLKNIDKFILSIEKIIVNKYINKKYYNLESIADLYYNVYINNFSENDLINIFNKSFQK